MNEQNYLKYLSYFSLITVKEDKTPNFKWKEQTEKKLSEDEFLSHFRSPTTAAVGIVTGFEDLEVVDVDLKVFSTTSEKLSFWVEFVELLKESIFDFDKKFVIYKTKNAGYHILYKTKRVDKNRKLAKLKGHQSAVIETRGIGGYVFMYPENRVSEKSYFDINYITDLDYQNLINICKMYDYVEVKDEVIDYSEKKVYKVKTSDIPPWEDFNNQTNVWDVVRDDFVLIKDTTDKVIIKRHGAESAHSGYIFKSDNRMYLHSTGTCYPAEKQISPYVAFTFKYHGGNFKESTKALYQQGFGDRLSLEIKKNEKSVIEISEENQIKKHDLIFPLDVFPQPFQNYILEAHSKMGNVIDYMGCSLLWTVSMCVGNSYRVKVKNSWYEHPVFWIALVGGAGIGKTPSINMILQPLRTENNREVRRYMREREKYDEYEKLDKKEKNNVISVEKPARTQFLVDDITQESLAYLHNSVMTGVGVFKDEMAGWLKDMNKYRDGSDLEFWLSSWSGSDTIVNRATGDKILYIESPFIPVIGGIQPNILSYVFTQEKKDNGFIDRMLLCYPDLQVNEYNDDEMSMDAILWYNDVITNLKRKIKNNVKLDLNGSIVKNDVVFSEGAKQLWIKKFNEITKYQNSDDENEYFKSLYPKLKSYIPRFAFILNVLSSYFQSGNVSTEISEQSMDGAIKLSEYFIVMAKKLKFEREEQSQIEKSINNRSISTGDKIKDALNVNPNLNRSKLAEILGVSRQTIQKYIKELNK